MWKVYHDIAYSNEEKTKLDIWVPTKPLHKTPACVLIHGGGWTTGDKDDPREREMASELCAMGYAVFSINYRMAIYAIEPYKGNREYCAWPNCIEDSMDAVSFVRQNAEEWNIDASKICVVGSSAGGHLALLVAAAAKNEQLNQYRKYSAIPCDVSCAISMYGVSDLAQWDNGDLLMPTPYAESVSEWELANPTYHINKETPPLLLIHGDKDKTVSIGQSLRFLENAKPQGANVQLIIINGAEHSFDFSALNTQQYTILSDFLKNYLRKESII